MDNPLRAFGVLITYALGRVFPSLSRHGGIRVSRAFDAEYAKHMHESRHAMALAEKTLAEQKKNAGAMSATLDSLAPTSSGWVYKTWQKAADGRLNESEVCIGVATGLGNSLALSDAMALAELLALSCVKAKHPSALVLAASLGPLTSAAEESEQDPALAPARHLWSAMADRAIELAVQAEPLAMKTTLDEERGILDQPMPGFVLPRLAAIAALHERIVLAASVACEAQDLTQATEPAHDAQPTPPRRRSMAL